MNTFEIRPLTSADIFPLTKILSKIGIKELKDVIDPDTLSGLMGAFYKKKGNDDLMQYGARIALDVAGLVLTNLASCETELYSFLASVTGASVKDLRACPPADFAELIIKVARAEEFKDFFALASKLLR